MATSPNYGWLEPDNTDLVKNGALAIRTLGNAIDTTMATMTPKSLVDAKGDLITATANDTPARLAVGNNGETLVADSSTATGLRYQATQAAGKNYVINGNFDIWQRGTSGFTTTNTYTADRWYNQSGTGSISRQTTGVPVGSQYCLRAASTANGGYVTMASMLESSQIAPLLGQTVTASIKIRRSASFTAGGIYFALMKSATVDAAFGATWTAITDTTIANATIPTGTTSADWYRVTITATVPNDGTANSLRVIAYAPSGLDASQYYEISQVQLELGSVATTFSRAGGTIQGELAACQRYYIRTTGNNSSALLGTLGFAKSTSLAVMSFALPVTMRSAVSAIDVGGTPQIADGNTGYSGGTWALDSTSSTNCTVTYTHGSASLTQYRPYFPQATTGTSYIGFSAEL